MIVLGSQYLTTFFSVVIAYYVKICYNYINLFKITRDYLEVHLEVAFDLSLLDIFKSFN